MVEVFSSKEREFLSNLAKLDRGGNEIPSKDLHKIITSVGELGTIDDWQAKFTRAGIMVTPNDNYLVKEENRLSKNPETKIYINRQQLIKYLIGKDQSNDKTR